jgi:hypothetical protein
MNQPQIIIDNYNVGQHNSDLQHSINRLHKSGTYKDTSTICIIPTRGQIAAKVVQNWWSLMSPMNGKFMRIFMIGMEVGHAYSTAIEQVLANPELSKWKYILTLEEDNIIPPDGLLKLIESIEGGVDGNKYSAMGSLYWTKGYGGQPMIYGNPNEMPRNFIPQLPVVNSIVPCNGLGMGFTLFRLNMFKNEKIIRPLFETIQVYNPGGGSTCTQDLNFFNKACELNFKFACDCRVMVGHYDYDGTYGQADLVW